MEVSRSKGNHCTDWT